MDGIIDSLKLARKCVAINSQLRYDYPNVAYFNDFAIEQLGALNDD